MDEPSWEERTKDVLSEITLEKAEELCQGVTTPGAVATFLGKSREPILEGALINVHHRLACEPIPGKPHQILITDHHLWHDYIDYFAGSKPNQTKSRVNRNKSFSSRWFKMPPGRKPKSFIIETYPARRKDVERKLAIVRSKVGDKASPKKIKIGDTVKVFTPPNPNQLLILLAQRKLSSTKSIISHSLKPRVGKKRPRRSVTRNALEKIKKEMEQEEEQDEEQDEEEEDDDEYEEEDSSSPKSPKRSRIENTEPQLTEKVEPPAAAQASSSQELIVSNGLTAVARLASICVAETNDFDTDLDRGTYLLLRISE